MIPSYFHEIKSQLLTTTANYQTTLNHENQIVVFSIQLLTTGYHLLGFPDFVTRVTSCSLVSYELILILKENSDIEPTNQPY